MIVPPGFSLVLLGDEAFLVDPTFRASWTLEGDFTEFVAALVGANDPHLSNNVILELGDALEQLGLHPGRERPIWPDDVFGNSGHAWAAYWSGRNAVPHMDYASSNALETDLAMMRRYAHEGDFSVEPASEETSSALIALPHPAWCGTPTEFLSRLGALLFWSVGMIRQASLAGAGPAYLKPVPSKGARHPVNAIVSIGEGVPGLPAGRWRYRPFHHALERIGLDPDDVSLTVDFTLWFDPVLWRYRDGWAYKDMYLDVGHVCAGLEAAAGWLGVELHERRCGLAATSNSPMREECVRSYEVNTGSLGIACGEQQGQRTIRPYAVREA